MQIRACVLVTVLLGCSHGLLADTLYSVKDLGTLGGDFSRGSGINNAGQVTGQSAASSIGDIHAFLYSNGQMKDLGTLGGGLSQGNGINNAGQVTGYSSTSTGFTHAFLYSNGQMMDLGTPGRRLQ